MKLLKHLISIALISCIAGSAAAADEAKSDAQKHADAWQNSQGWWNATDIPAFDQSKITQQVPLVKVKGNKFVNDKGDVVVFRGVNISDPDKLVNQGHFNRKHFEVIKAWGANVVRIPVHPSAWQKRGKKGSSISIFGTA